MLHVDIDLKDGVGFNLTGDIAEKATHISFDEDFVYFGDIIMTPKDNLNSYYRHEGEPNKE